MNQRSKQTPIGGIVHTYLKYDPRNFPSPTQPPPDMVSPLMNQLLTYGSLRELSEDELARAIRLDPEQIQALGPSLETIRAMLEEKKRKILETWETGTVQQLAADRFHQLAARPPAIKTKKLRDIYREGTANEQLYCLEQLWFLQGDDHGQLGRHLIRLIDYLGEKYEIDELASKYDFVGNRAMSIPQALEIKQLLEKIDELLEQLEEAEKEGQIAIVNLDELAEFMDDQSMQALEELQRMIENHVREMAQRQGIEYENGRFHLTPKAFRTFQNKLLARIFSDLQASRSGRHEGDVGGEGAVELPSTRRYEFGDSVANMDIPQTFINALVRDPTRGAIHLKSEDIEIHRTRNRPKCATVILMDMSGSMRYDGQYINVKRMAMAMDGLIRSEYPGDYLNFVEMYTFAKIRRPSEIVELLPRPVTLFDPWVQLKVDMSRPDLSESMVHQHFTNIQHALRLARQMLANQNTPNRQIILITDGLPTAHFEESTLYMLYPPQPRTEQATMREAKQCAREGITINMFLVPSWSQSEEDVRFAYRMCEATRGRVFFTAGKDLDRFVVWDYVQHKRDVI